MKIHPELHLITVEIQLDKQIWPVITPSTSLLNGKNVEGMYNFHVKLNLEHFLFQKFFDRTIRCGAAGTIPNSASRGSFIEIFIRTKNGQN